MGDKGGEYVKLGVTFLNTEKPQSRYSVLPLAMYHGGNEEYEYVNDFLKKTICDIQDWAESVPSIHRSWKVKLLLGGDTKWLWTVMGISQNGTCFCPFCICSSNELGEKHDSVTIHDNCRTYDNHMIMVQIYNKYINKELLVPKGLTEAGAAQNCVRQQIVSRELYENIIIPMLHIDNGMGTFSMDESVRIQRKKAMIFRFANQANQPEKNSRTN